MSIQRYDIFGWEWEDEKDDEGKWCIFDDVEAQLIAVRNATLDEVAQMMRSDSETDYGNWREYSAFWQSKLRFMQVPQKEGE
jgi:hypothetical protein